MGCIASNISVGLVEPGHVHRGGVKGGAAHTVYRTGEVHGSITERAHEVCRLVSYADSAKVTDNLWGERWSKLVANTDRKSTRLNSSHANISYAVFCLKKKIR